MKPENTLTPRQLAVVRALSSGASNPAIAKELKISLGSVKNYIHVACDKIGAENRVMLARWYWERYESDIREIERSKLNSKAGNAFLTG